MADMYGAVSSNAFTVKDVESFKAWFEKYHFGHDVTLCVHHEELREVHFTGYEQYPSSYPRKYDEETEDYVEVELKQFALELVEYLEEGEVFAVVGGGNEKLRYVSYDQLIIAKAYPEHPIYRIVTSEADHSTLMGIVEADIAQERQEGAA
jgi:hypothetical protein